MTKYMYLYSVLSLPLLITSLISTFHFTDPTDPKTFVTGTPTTILVLARNHLGGLLFAIDYDIHTLNLYQWNYQPYKHRGHVRDRPFTSWQQQF